MVYIIFKKKINSLIFALILNIHKLHFKPAQKVTPIPGTIYRLVD